MLLRGIKQKFTYFANGGKTATALKPAGSNAKDAVKVARLPSVGAPPPPVVPGCGELPVAWPLCWKFRSAIIAIPAMPTMDTPSVEPA